MCLMCGASALYAGYKSNKALDAAFSVKDEPPVESYFKTELRHSFAVLGASKTSGQRDLYESAGASRKMSKKEQESRARLQALVDAHAPSKKGSSNRQ